MLVPILALALQAAPTAAIPTIECSAANPASCGTSIYFDSGEARVIRPEWLAVLDALAAGLRSAGQIRLDGFSDRSGPDATNRRLSQVRAESVRAALLQRGVPAAAIRLTAHGEDDPLVATPDGVREPQNRRVDLTLVR